MNFLKKIKKYAFAISLVINLLLIFQLFNQVQSVNATPQEIKISGTIPHNNILWLQNPTFADPISPWYSSIEGDSTDVFASTSPNQANFEINGESYEQQVLLNNATYSNWEAFNKSDLALVPQRSGVQTYGVDSNGAWCSHLWWEGDTGGQPKNTPEMHWRTNISLSVDMSDYIITDVKFEALINASVNDDIDTPGDTYARWTPSRVTINQHEKYDFARFYVEITTLDIQELNTYQIAFNQTRLLGNEPLNLNDIEGLIGAYEEQAIIDALTNVLAADPGHNNFTVVLGIYMYCEDNRSDTDRDDWTELRFKNLNLTFTYVKKIDQFTTVSWNQNLNEITGSNVQITDANLKLKYKIDQNWTLSSQNSRIKIFINDREYKEEPIYLIDYIFTPDFQEAKTEGFDILSKILPYENFTLTIQVFLAENFGLDHDITISITDVYLYISYTETLPDLIPEPWLFAGLFIIALVAAIIIASYFIAYHLYLKYPIPIRKLRKYRKTLPHENEPEVNIISRESAFKRTFHEEINKTAKILKGEPLDGKVTKEKIFGKASKSL